MFALVIIAQLTTVHPLGSIPKHCDAGRSCDAAPAAWSSLQPDAQGRFMVLDHGRWRWHSLEELFERD